MKKLMMVLIFAGLTAKMAHSGSENAKTSLTDRQTQIEHILNGGK